MIPTHPCTAWCSTTSHVDLVHAAEAWTLDDIAEHVVNDYAALGVTIAVDGVERAGEAPPSAEPHAPNQPPRPAWVVRWHVDAG